MFKELNRTILASQSVSVSKSEHSIETFLFSFFIFKAYTCDFFPFANYLQAYKKEKAIITCPAFQYSS